MAFIIEYNDVTAINLYALVFDENNFAYKPSISGISSYTDLNATGFAIPLSEDFIRVGNYSAFFDNSYFSGVNTFNVLIYQYTSTVVDRYNDILKAEQTIYWDGSRSIGALTSPKIINDNYLGNYYLGNQLNSYISVNNKYGKIAQADGNVTYKLYRPDGTLLVSGNYSNAGPSTAPQYSLGITLTSGTYGFGNHRLQIEATMNGAQARGNSYFTISNQNTYSMDAILGTLAWATGYINDSTPNASSFIVSVSSPSNDCFNGQIFISYDTNLIGQGRIVSDFVQSTKRITLSKALTNPPTSGTRFAIIPIGGELNVP